MKDVLVLLYISTNLLSKYQVYHLGMGKKIDFAPHDVIIRDLSDHDVVVATRIISPTSWLYHFDGFESLPPFVSYFIANVDSLSNLWHEHFGHVNYKYSQQMSTKALVIGSPKISFT